MTNLTRFAIRRFDLNISVAYKEDIAQVKKLLLELVDQDPKCLEDPEPMVVLESFADSGILLRLAVWAKTQDFIQFKSHLSERVKQLLDQHGIEIPFPHVSLYAGSQSEPIRIAMVDPLTPGSQPLGAAGQSAADKRSPTTDADQ
jgi:small-conductance mechanosensitive channel